MVSERTAFLRGCAVDGGKASPKEAKGKSYGKEAGEAHVEACGKMFRLRFILGSGKYSLELIRAAVEYAGAEMVTLACARIREGQSILDYIPAHVTPCRTRRAHAWQRKPCASLMARELGCGDFIKVDYARCEVPSVAQRGDGSRDETALPRLHCPAVHVSRPCGARLNRAGGGHAAAAPSARIRIAGEGVQQDSASRSSTCRSSSMRALAGRRKRSDGSGAAVMANTAIATAGVTWRRCGHSPRSSGRVAYLCGGRESLERRGRRDPLTGFLHGGEATR